MVCTARASELTYIEEANDALHCEPIQVGEHDAVARPLGQKF